MLTVTLKMTTAQVVEKSVTVNNNSPIQDYVHPDNQTQPFHHLLSFVFLFSDSRRKVVTLRNGPITFRVFIASK